MEASPERRPATARELKALGNPLRLRILRLCLDEALTNRQLADRLDRDPATVLHHVRTLVETGFLAPEPVRTGPSGALEKPYRSTGKSWTLDIDHPAATADAALTVLDATRQELLESPRDEAEHVTRVALHLDAASRAELGQRLQALVEEYVGREPGPGTQPYAALVILHRRS
jgi:DNA-binding transcriptional ArsR family regulator